MSPNYARLRQAKCLLVVCLLGSVFVGANGKRSEKYRREADSPTTFGTSEMIVAPTDLKAHVSCENKVNLTWKYTPGYDITDFLLTLCHQDGSACLNTTIYAQQRIFTYSLSNSVAYQAKLFACNIYHGATTCSLPAEVGFTSYPQIPDLKDLTITAIGPTALKAQWNTKWDKDIQFAVCSDQELCTNETVAGKELEHIFPDLLPSTSYVVSAQAEATVNNQTCKGSIRKKSATTLPIEAPTNLMVTLSCDNTVHATWQYKEQDISGFRTKLCHQNGSTCREQKLPASSRDVTYAVTEPNTTFKVSVWAFVDPNHTSAPEEVTFITFPQLPALEDLEVTGLSPTEVQATWSEKWSHDIEFTVCFEPAQCKTQTVPGDLLSYNFTGLEPDTEYTVSAQAKIARQNKTCKGHKQERDASTSRADPPTDLTVHVLCTNEANVSWKYPDRTWPTGFIASLCYENDQQLHCKNKTISRTDPHCSFQLPEFDFVYNITVWAYKKTEMHKSFSLPAETEVTSYPNLPVLGSVNVTGVSTTELLVSWRDKWVREIYFTVCSSPMECHNETAEGTQQKQTFDGLQENTTYTVSLKTGATLNNRTCFGHAQIYKGSTFVTRPGKVEIFKGEIVNGTLLEATWDAPGGQENVSGYTLECSDAHSHYNETIDIVGGKKAYYVSLPLHEIAATFNCSVRAFNRDTGGHRVYGPPDSIDVTTNGIAAPVDVTLVSCTATSFTFTWSADPNATKCEVEVHREGDYGDSLQRIEACGESVNGSVVHNVTGLDPWTCYNVSIKNCRDAFCGEPAFAVSTTEVAAPSDVQNFSYAIKNDTSVHFFWRAPEHPNGPLDGYSLRIFDEDTQEMKRLNISSNDTDTTLDLKYQFHLFNVSIAAFNYDNITNATLYSSESELSFETLGQGPMPPRPKAEDVKEHSVLLFWQEPEDPRYNITGFEVKVPGKTPFMITARNVTIEHLNPWTNYEVNVSSCTNKTSCGQQRDFAFRTDFGAPSEPLDFKAPSAGKHWMLVQWKKPKVLNGPLSGYNLTFSYGGGRSHATTTQLSYNATDLIAGTSYEVSVYAFNEVESVIKHGPAVTLQASTEADTPSTAGASTATIVLAVLIPLIFLLLIAAFFLYKKYQKRTGERTPLTSAVDS